MATPIYQHGLADSVSLNMIVSGETVNGKFEVPLPRTMNFADSSIKIKKGWTKLKKHSISGPVEFTMSYSTSGPEEQKKKDEQAEASTSLQMTELVEDDDEYEDQRTPRTTNKASEGVAAFLQANRTLKDWLKQIQELVNKP